MNPSQGGFGQTPGTNISFGQQPGNQQAGSPFSQPAQSTATAIVNPLTTGGFNFSSPQTTPAFTAQNTNSASPGGFSFSTPTTVQQPPPASGFTLTGQSAFPHGGTTATTQSSFGFSSTGAFSPAQGAQSNMAGSFNFAQPHGQPGGLTTQPTGMLSFSQPSVENTSGFGQSSTAGFNVASAGNLTAPTGMGAFNFGNSTTSTPGINLGGSITSQGTSGGFSIGATSAPTSSIGFGPPAPSVASTGGINFPSQFSVASGGFNMGTPPTNASVGGFTLNSAPNTVSPGGFTMGSTPVSNVGFNFSSGGTPSTGQFNMVNAASTSAFPIGSTASAGSTGFNLGTTPVTSIQSSSTGFNQGIVSSNSLSGGFNLSSSTVPSAGGLGLSGTQSGGLNFHNTAPISSTFGIQGAAANANLTTPVAPASSMAFNLGSNTSVTPVGFNLNTVAGTSAGSFNFSQPGTTTVGSGLPLSTIGSGLPLPTIGSGLPLPTIGSGLPLPTIGSGLPLPTIGTAAVSSSIPGFSVGQLTSQASSSAGFSLGPAAPPTGSMNFIGATPNLGLTTAPTAANSTTVTQTSGTVGTFNFTSSTTKPGDFTLGTTATTSSGFSFGLPTQSSSASLTPGQPTATTIAGLGGTSTALVGLGGAHTPAADSGQTSSKSDGKSIRDAPLPPDIFATIAQFETYKDGEKKSSEENARQSATPFHKLGEDAKKLRQHIVTLSNQHSLLHSSASKLKSLVVQDALNVEMGRRTQDTPMNVQGENKAPEEFFLKMVRFFEARMASCRNKIEEVEKGCMFKDGNSKATPEDIMVVLKREHKTVKMMAAQVYSLHNKLIDVYQQVDSQVQPKPELLFRNGSPEKVDLMSIINKNSSVLRPCFGDVTSGLLEFQHGQEKAKALSLNSAPPTQPLGQTNSSFLAPQGPSNIFNSSFLSTPTTQTVGQNNNNNSFNFAKRPFASTSTSFSSPFGTQNQSNTSLFGSNPNNSSFGMFTK